MNLRLIEHRINANNNCIIQILSNDGYYYRLQNCKDFGLSIKYKNMDNFRMSIGTNCIVVDHLFHHLENNKTVLVCMENLNDNKYTLIQTNIKYIKLIKDKIPEPHK